MFLCLFSSFCCTQDYKKGFIVCVCVIGCRARVGQFTHGRDLSENRIAQIDPDLTTESSDVI